MFSARVPTDRRPNRLARALEDVRRRGGTPIDLTVTNPTAVGLTYPASLLHGLSSPAALTYSPHPFGLDEARAAVAMDYRRRGLAAEADRVILTASTSEAYSLLFKLLCDPGDAVLVPVPSYPLFDHLARLDAVQAVAYRLEYHGRWTLGPDAIEAVSVPHARAALAVTPNNPTGSFLSSDELRMLDACCAARRMAVVLDEVFADYPLREGVAPSSWPQPSALTFRLGGLSKSAGLPQVKLGWMYVDGPAPLVADALDRLELVCDTYLSVSTPVQVAAAGLIERGAAVREQTIARVRANYAVLCRQAALHPAVEVLPAEAGWTAVLRIPSTRDEEAFVLDLLERAGVLVHPGFFFDFPHEAFVVLSLLPEPSAFAEGARRLLESADA